MRVHARENTRQRKSTLTLGNGIITNDKLLTQVGKKMPKKIQACTGFKLLTYAIPIEQENHLGAGHYKNGSFPWFKSFTNIGHLRI